MRKSEITHYILEANPHLSERELQLLVKTLDQMIKTYWDMRALRLARISHQRSATPPRMPASPALRSKNVLDVLSSTPRGIFLRAPCSHGHLRRLAMIAGEKCGLGLVGNGGQGGESIALGAWSQAN